MRHIIAYDISDPRRLQKAHRYLIQHAIPLQKAHRYLIQHAIPLQNSIFLHIGSREQARQCFEELCRMLHPKQDDLRFYPLANSSIIHTLGQTALPEGIILGNFGTL